MAFLCTLLLLAVYETGTISNTHAHRRVFRWRSYGLFAFILVQCLASLTRLFRNPRKKLEREIGKLAKEFTTIRFPHASMHSLASCRFISLVGLLVEIIRTGQFLYVLLRLLLLPRVGKDVCSFHNHRIIATPVCER
jgi:hypothetical protein